MQEPRKQMVMEVTPPPNLHPAIPVARDAARKAYLDALKCVEERERRMPPAIPADYEINIDEIATVVPRRSIQELLQRGRVMACKAAVDYIEVLRSSNKLHENMIQPCLREAARARCSKQQGC